MIAGFAVLAFTGLASAESSAALPRTVPPSVPPPTTAPPAPPPDAEEQESDISGGTGGTGAGGTGQTPVTLPVVPVPIGCDAPALPHVVFVGKVVDRDYRTVQFEIEQIRAGRADPFANADLINIRYGLDAQYLAEGESYLVSAPIDPDLGILVSRVTEPVENFGGDEVIGVSESDVDCPPFEDPVRTLHLDGTIVESGVLKPFWSEKLRLVSALLLPMAVAFGLVFALATFRLSLAGLYRSVTGAGSRRFS